MRSAFQLHNIGRPPSRERRGSSCIWASGQGASRPDTVTHCLPKVAAAIRTGTVSRLSLVVEGQAHLCVVPCNGGHFGGWMRAHAANPLCSLRVVASPIALIGQGPLHPMRRPILCRQGSVGPTQKRPPNRQPVGGLCVGLKEAALTALPWHPQMSWLWGWPDTGTLCSCRSGSPHWPSCRVGSRSFRRGGLASLHRVRRICGRGKRHPGHLH